MWLSMAGNDARSYPSLLTLREVSGTLRVSTKTVRRMIDRRELRAFRVGGQLRVERDSLIQLLTRGEVRS
jgi:excisionase family DNA binding protein